MKAADIPDSVVYVLILSGFDKLHLIQSQLVNFHPKVVRAKLCQMCNKGRLLLTAGVYVDPTIYEVDLVK